VAGTPLRFAWDYAALRFEMEWEETPGVGDTELIAPRWVKEAGFTLTVDGETVEPSYNEAGRLIIPAKTEAGRRNVGVQAEGGSGE